MALPPTSATKLPYRNWKIHHVILGFYFGYFLMTLAGNIFIQYKTISPLTLIVIIVYVIAVFSGALIGEALKIPKIKLSAFLSLDSALWLGSGIALLALLYTWYLHLQFYGSLSYMIANAFTIRSETIGGGRQITPVYIGYLSSLAYGLFALALAMYGNLRTWRYVIAATLLFVLCALGDLVTFGRIGMLYAIFSLIGFFLIFKVAIFRPRNIILLFVLFALLMLPRLLRGSFDNFEGSLWSIYPFLKIQLPVSLNPFLATYIYYFSSPYALDAYLESAGFASQYSWGLRTFTPIVRILNRFIGVDYISTIDPMVYIPFNFNIYTIIRDYYQDFGLLGIVLLPLLSGISMGIIFRWKGTIYDAIKIYLIGWLFYTPIFNAFSFGGFMISFAFLIAVMLVCKRDTIGSRQRGHIRNSFSAEMA